MKIVIEKTKRQYEFTYLLDSSLIEGERTEFGKKIEALVKKHQGKILNKDDWGSKPLAYSLRKKGKIFREAFYSHWLIEFPAVNVQAFDKNINLNEDILRHLLVVAEDDVNEEFTQEESAE